MRLAPDLADVGDMAEPDNAKGTRELAQLLRRQGPWVLAVTIACEKEAQLDAPVGDEPEGVYQSHDPFVPQHASDEGGGHRRRRLG
jgi:hypothetical protein